MEIQNYPVLTNRIATGLEIPPIPEGWNQRIYRTNEGPFHFEKENLQISPGVFVEDIRLIQGAIRVNGFIEDNRLQIGIFESEDYNIIGVSGPKKICSVAYNGSSWDATAHAPSRGITFNAAHSVASKIISSEKRVSLQEKMQNAGQAVSLIFDFSDEFSDLQITIRFLLNLCKELGCKNVKTHILNMFE